MYSLEGKPSLSRKVLKEDKVLVVGNNSIRVFKPATIEVNASNSFGGVGNERS